jgi:4,5-DOPA dioxygenase extradiol
MSKTPLIFFGHGSPMNALGGQFAQAWRALGETIPKPRAMLMVSAHWYIEETAVTAMQRPRTIHDFTGFPPELYEMQYPAPGAPWLAERVAQILAPTPVRQDGDWGLDHGTWSVLAHLWPDADVPVVQLAIDATRAPAFHYELGRMLAPLRDEGVLIAGSGDVVHNLGLMRRDGTAFDWATRFHDRVKTAILAEDHAALTEYDALGEDAALSIPTAEHYLPLLYVLGTRAPGEPASFFTDALELGSVSMLGVRFS